MTENKVKSIALFIPHLGCPHKCTFCNQNAISFSFDMPDKNDMESAVCKAVESYPSNMLEIAFFGGSFTCINEKTMRNYLEWAQELVDKYSLHGIRFSTRPDGINSKIMDIISAYTITAIELGAQSMIDSVLDMCDRGHTSQDTLNAVKLIKDKDIELVLQMMTGLPASTPESDLKTAEIIAELKPDSVRIYPSIVFKNTKMCEEYKNGKYMPQSLDEAISLCKKLLLFFESKHISVIKLGLNAEKDFENTMVAGPYHPAFRELVEAEIYFDKIVDGLSKLGGKGKIIYSPSLTSKIIGHKKKNLIRLFDMFGRENIEFVSDNMLSAGEFFIK